MNQTTPLWALVCSQIWCREHDRLDMEPSSNRRASMPTRGDDRPELLGEAGASPQLLAISVSGAGTSQGSPMAPSGPGPLTWARSWRTGIMPTPLTELRLRWPHLSQTTQRGSDEPARRGDCSISPPMMRHNTPWDPDNIGDSHALYGQPPSLEAREGESGALPPATQSCRGTEALRPTPLAEAETSRADPTDVPGDPGPSKVPTNPMDASGSVLAQARRGDLLSRSAPAAAGRLRSPSRQSTSHGDTLSRGDMPSRQGHSRGPWEGSHSGRG